MSTPNTPSILKDRATRDSFGEVIKELGEEFPKIVVLDADLSCSTKSILFAKAFPDRFFQMGIAEANMVGTAAGLSFTGCIPFCCSFGAFVAGRYETIRVSVGYSKANVKIVGTHSGLGIGEDGYTQMGLEDVNIMRGLPGMIILNPSDDATTRAAVRFAATHEGPVYLRLTRQKLPALHQETDFQMGRGIVLKEGKSLALVGTGSTVTECLKASQSLTQFNPWVVDIHTIKPIDKALIKTLARNCKLIVSAEDHNIVGGLGTAIAEVLAEEGWSGKLVRLGVQDTYGESGLADELYEKYGFSAGKITKKVMSLLG
ncbi:MAG: transketolase family protein [Proteobacteria bacterium]|nr:transketolase family protein [Pseudomonadota bacterium]NQW44854.1 transketolase family protein [Deltaproteobacteria bacterium]